MRPLLSAANRLFILTVILSSPILRATAQAPAAPPPDVVVFTNGDQLTGAVLRGVGDSIVFKSDMAGEITIPLAKIKELRSQSKFAVLRKGAPITPKATVPAGTLAVGDNVVTLATPTAALLTVPDKDVAFIIDSDTYNKEVGHHGFKDGWNGSITGGATVVSSTQNGSTLTAGIALVRTIPTVPWLPRRDRTIFDLVETYGKLTQPVIPQTIPPSPDTTVKTSIFHSDIEQDKYLSARFYVLALASWDHNFSQGLNLQQIYGGGVGWTAVLTPKQELDLTANIHYERQAFIDPTQNQNLIGATVGEAYLYHFPHGILFTESGSFLPAFNNSSAYSANFAAGLALPTYHRFTLVLGTTDSYLHQPSAGFKNNSFQFVTGITYNLH
jgi:Protein of unknown function, DUF481